MKAPVPAGNCSYHGNPVSPAVDLAPSTDNIFHIRLLCPLSGRRRAGMFENVRHPWAVLFHLVTIFLQDLLRFPLSSTVYIRLHIQYGVRNDAKDRQRSNHMCDSRSKGAGKKGECGIREGATDHEWWNEVRSVLVCLKPLLCQELGGCVGEQRFDRNLGVAKCYTYSRVVRECSAGRW